MLSRKLIRRTVYYPEVERRAWIAYWEQEKDERRLEHRLIVASIRVLKRCSHTLHSAIAVACEFRAQRWAGVSPVEAWKKAVRHRERTISKDNLVLPLVALYGIEGEKA